MTGRRKFLKTGGIISAGILLNKTNLFAKRAQDFESRRPPLADRKFTSTAVENAVKAVKNKTGNKEMAWLFDNCFPNTLDTTVDFETINGKPDTYVITGDIDAMWLRDSTAQVWPYLELIKEDAHLQQLIKGVINRQVKCILKDPYANAFYKDENKISEWKETDVTDMKPGIHERKWEIDSLCYPIRLAHGYWQVTGDVSAFDKDWVEAMKLILKTFREQQRKEDNGPYSFQRKTSWATDGVPLGGYGYPTKKIGLIHSMFRPSDDATIFPFLMPSNIFAMECLSYLYQMPTAAGINEPLQHDAGALAYEIGLAIHQGIVQHSQFGQIIAYEINGLGSYNLMDDANVPSLLSLPYLVKTPLANYQATRKFVLSASNPFFFKGAAGEGIGGPHAGENMIWPLSIIMRGLTSHNDKEIKLCLDMLQHSHAGTGFMHESFHKDDATKFSRKWFAWANTLFGELVLKLHHTKPALLNEI
jgi:uncharacterized protein